MYNLNKFTANILKAYVKDEYNNSNNSTTFYNYIRNVPIENERIMVSFDVTSLYTNIPIIDTWNITKDYVNNDYHFTRNTDIRQGKFLDIVNLVLTTTFNSQFYQHTDGVAMAGPASLTTAEISMRTCKLTAIFTELYPLNIWKWFVDNVYSILKCTHLQNVFPSHHQFSSKN